MARRGAKPDISDEQFKAVIAYLEEPKSTKKAACELLGIAYNTKRLDTLIQEWKDNQDLAARMRKEKRRQACTPQELVNMIEDYLDGASFDEMSKRFYRSTAYIKHKLELSGALIRCNTSVSPLKPPMLPDECVLLEEDFRPRVRIEFEVETQAQYDAKLQQLIAENEWDKANVMEVYSRTSKFDTKRAVDYRGELVWLPGYQCLGEIIKEVPTKCGCKAYRIFIFKDDRHQYVNIPAWDIGSLRHLVALGVDVSRMGSFINSTECKSLLNKALEAARKNKDKDK